MSIRCPDCKREYDVTLFEFGRNVACECGYRIGLIKELTGKELRRIHDPETGLSLW